MAGEIERLGEENRQLRTVIGMYAEDNQQLRAAIGMYREVARRYALQQESTALSDRQEP
jgi:hypothetical protein